MRQQKSKPVVEAFFRWCDSSDDVGEVNATLGTWLASCQMHSIELIGYLRDLLCLIPSWPKQQVLELAPAYWSKTIAGPEVQQQLEANAFRSGRARIQEVSWRRARPDHERPSPNAYSYSY